VRLPAPRRIGLDHRQGRAHSWSALRRNHRANRRDPSTSYDGLTQELGEPFYERIDAAATQEQKKILSTASAEQIGVDELAGEAVTAILTKTPVPDFRLAASR